MNRKVEKVLTVIVLLVCMSRMECLEDMTSEIETGNNQDAFLEKLSLIKSIRKDIENQYNLLIEIDNGLNLEKNVPEFKNLVMYNKSKLESLVSKDSSSEIDENQITRNNMKRFDWFKRNIFSSRYSKIPVIRTG